MGESKSWKKGAWLLALALISVGIFPEELSSILFLGVASWFGLRERKLGLLRWPVWLLAMLLLNGFLFAWRHPLSDIIKDVWYFSLPLVTLLAGWFCVGKMAPRNTFKIIYLISGVYSLYFIFSALYYVFLGKVSLNDQYALRQLLGAGEIISAWGCLMFFGRSLGDVIFVNETDVWTLPVFLVNITAILISGSRTSLILMLLGLLLAILPYKISVRRRRAYWLVIGGVTLGVIAFGLFIAPQFADSRTALGRLANTFTEVFNFNFRDIADINQKWRAYESLMALSTYLQGGVVEYLFGQGFGALVDLQMVQGLGAGANIVEFQFIPVLHNGYMMLLVKTGLCGVFFYVSFIYYLISRCREKLRRGEERFWCSLSMAILIGTIFATFVIAGPFAKGVYFTSFLILGASLRHAFARV